MLWIRRNGSLTTGPTNNEPTPATAPLIRDCGNPPLLGFHADGRKVERYAGSLLRRAIDRQMAAMPLDQPADDAEPQTGAAELARQSAIDLAERADRHGGGFGRDTGSAIGNAQPGEPFATNGDRYTNRRFRGAEFCGVRQQLQQHLLDRPRVGVDRIGRSTDRQHNLAVPPYLALPELRQDRLG